MLAAEAAYCELEQELQYELDHYEALHPGYDEYLLFKEHLQFLLNLVDGEHPFMERRENGDQHIRVMFDLPYNYYICNVKLENFDLSHVPVYIMDEEMLSLYAVYMATLGNRDSS